GCPTSPAAARVPPGPRGVTWPARWPTSGSRGGMSECRGATTWTVPSRSCAGSTRARLASNRAPPGRGTATRPTRRCGQNSQTSTSRTQRCGRSPRITAVASRDHAGGNGHLPERGNRPRPAAIAGCHIAGLTEGWAAGMQRAALSLQRQSDLAGFVATFAGSNRYVLDYPTEEVLARQPAEVVRFLLETSVLERLCGLLCDAVTGRTDSQGQLEELERVNLLCCRWMTCAAGDATTIRSPACSVTTLSKAARAGARAAAWHEEHGFADDAVRHALAAGETGWAARLVERNVEARLQRSEGRRCAAGFPRCGRLRSVPGRACAGPGGHRRRRQPPGGGRAPADRRPWAEQARAVRTAGVKKCHSFGWCLVFKGKHQRKERSCEFSSRERPGHWGSTLFLVWSRRATRSPRPRGRPVRPGSCARRARNR